MKGLKTKHVDYHLCKSVRKGAHFFPQIIPQLMFS